MLKKVVIIGPENSGKSTLCQQLADHYNARWCPEKAREYLLSHGTDYTYDDLLAIAKGQVELEEKYISEARNNNEPVVFIDTDMYVMKVWCEFSFQKCHPYILNQIVDRQYELYLLCESDIPWIPDPLREYPDPEIRRKIYLIYKDIMVNQRVPWANIRGSFKQRLNLAIKAVDKLLNQ